MIEGGENMRRRIIFVMQLALMLVASNAAGQVACDYVFGIGKFAQPNPNQEIVEPTKRAVKQLFADKTVCIRPLSTKDLKDAIEKGELDFFISSSGMYRRMLHTGVRDVAAVQGELIGNPNYAEGTLFVADAKRYPLGRLEQFRGGVLAAGIPVGFTGYLAGIHEMRHQGIHADSFFSTIDFVGADQFEILNRVLAGEADIGMLRTCMLEAYLLKHPDKAQRFRIVNEKTHDGFACRHSTELYPSWVFGVSRKIDVTTATKLTTALLKMPATASGLGWGIATDFSFVDKLLRDLQLGPFKHSDHWYVARIWERYSTEILFVLSMILMLFAHAWRSERLVQQRTRELNEAHAQEIYLKTERNQAREKILDMQRIGVVGQFSSLLIHELGQPSSANLFLIHAFKRRMESQEPTKQTVEEVLNKLLTNVQREQRLIDKIRKYTKNKPTSKTPVDVCTCLRNAKAIIAKSLSEPVVFSLDLPQIPILIQADELELEILFVNLVKNATEAVRGVAEPRVSILCHSTPEIATVVVRDNGPWFSDEKICQIGEPLKSGKDVGLGLGLYICQMIVEKYGANMRFARADVHGGICTTVTIPLAEKSL